MTEEKSQSRLNQYQCENCGVYVSIESPIPRCLGCGKALCEICNNFMICPADFHRLEKSDQKKIKKKSAMLETAKTSGKVFTIMPAIMGSIGIVLLLLLIFLHGFIFYFLFGFLGGSLLLMALFFFGMFRNFEERETKRITREIREILIPYQIEPFKNMQSELHSISETSKRLEFCPSCGERISRLDLQYCETCGASLVSK